MPFSELTFLLHVSHEVTFSAYLSRVLFHLVAFGGIALLVYSLVRILDDTQFVAGRDSDEPER